MAATLPLAGFEVRRWLRLAKDRALLTVREEVENTGALGRMYNMVQHPDYWAALSRRDHGS